jgi:hypothetical protein
MSDGYVLRQYGDEVQEILDDVQQKTVYERATPSKDGLMSKEDKSKLDTIDNIEADEELTLEEIDALLNF